MDLVSNDCSRILHQTYHKFIEHMHRYYYDLVQGYKKDVTPSKRKIRQFNPEKMVGIDAIEKVKRYVKKHPEIKLVNVDDYCASGSYLVLIPHECNEAYWGTTIFFVPQSLSGRNEFFMYPDELDALIEELLAFQKRQKEGVDFWRDI